MKKIILSISCVAFAVAACSQTTADSIRGSQLDLDRPKTVVSKYVNFDVVKIGIAHGRSTGPLRNGVGLSIKGQLLWPYAMLKNTFIPIAWGLNFGSSKMTMPKTALHFANDKLVAATYDKNIRSSMQRTGYAGIIALYVHQIKTRGVTIMAGGSVNCNFYSKLRERRESGVEVIHSSRYIRKISTPLHFQWSVSKRQFWSGGMYFSYDLQSRFKGSAFSNVKQMEIGICTALII